MKSPIIKGKSKSIDTLACNSDLNMKLQHHKFGTAQVTEAQKVGQTIYHTK